MHSLIGVLFQYWTPRSSFGYWHMHLGLHAYCRMRQKKKTILNDVALTNNKWHPCLVPIKSNLSSMDAYRWPGSIVR